jgi:hypothetical protein
MKAAAIGSGAIALGGSVNVRRAHAHGPHATSPNNTVPAYVLPSTGGVSITPILTVGDHADNGYRMVGIPDGLGAYRHHDTFELFMNHELGATAGIVRAHGSKGAFVSRWTIDRRNFRVIEGRDMTPSPAHVFQWNPVTQQYVAGTTAWSRLCSADLPDEKALRHGNRGTDERLFCDGEEVTGGRAWARIATGPNAGQAWQLPRLGTMAYENVVACPHGKDKTIVALTDDANVLTAGIAANNPSEVYIYVGEKQRHGSEIERAGLTNGKFHGVRVRRHGVVVKEESDQFGLGDATTGYVGRARFELVELGDDGDVSALTSPQLEQQSIDNDVFRVQRPEDSAWDPRGSGKDALYFVTTASISPLRNSRLWRLTFDDIDRPERGGHIEILVTNSEGRMFDNITIDRLGRVLLQEDTGNNPYISKIRLYGIDDESLTEIAHHDPDLFEPGGAHFITQDEESSGIIDAHDILGEGWFLFDVQVHLASPDPELVEGGQLLAMHVHPRIGR